MKFTFSVANEKTNERNKFVVKMGSSEVAWHIALKVLGYILFFDRKPQIEQDVGQHYRPDLFAWDEFQEKVALWIDCGNIAVKKIDKVATSMGKRGEFYILRRSKYDAERLCEQIKNIKHPERVKIITFEDGFVDRLAGLIKSTNHLDFSIYTYHDAEGSVATLLDLTMNDVVASSRIVVVAGEYQCTS